MTKYRKQILLAVLGAILLWYGGDWLSESLWRAPLAKRHGTTERLREGIQKANLELARAKAASRQLTVWEAQSLPSNSEVARSLYQAWLLELVEYVELVNSNVTSGEPLKQKGMYHVIAFTVRGRGTLEQLTKFLFEFYSSAQLHQIRSISIIPSHSSSILDLSISVETLALPTADRQDRLATARSNRLTSYYLEDYDPIVGRNLFGIGTSPDATDHTYLSSVNSVNGEPEAWFTLRTEDKLFKLRKGDPLEIGQFQGTLTEIDNSDVVFESAGERWLLTVGENLAQACALPPKF